MATQAVETELRKTGIGAVGDVPWGTHFFMFYETKEDLLDTLVPYFKAGLETGELCLWAVSEPLTEKEARNALGKAVPELDRYLADRSIEIVTIRVRARLDVQKPTLVSQRPRSHTTKKPTLRQIHSAGAWHDTPVYARSSLPVTKLRGPALVLDYGSTTLIPAGWSFSVDKFGSLKITQRREAIKSA